jgi:hypothetical protein
MTATTTSPIMAKLVTGGSLLTTAGSIPIEQTKMSVGPNSRRLGVSSIFSMLV